MLYHARDRQHTQNIQINEVIAESEQCVFYFTKKPPHELFGQPNGIDRSHTLCPQLP